MRAATATETPTAPVRTATGLGVYEIKTSTWPNGTTGWDITATTQAACQAAIDSITRQIDEHGGFAEFRGPVKGFGAGWVAAGNGMIAGGRNG